MAKAAAKTSKKPAQPVKAAKAAKTVKLVKKTTVSKPKEKAEVKVAKLPAIKEPFNKTQLLQAIAEYTGLPKKDVGNVISCLAELLNGHISPKGPGEFTLPGLLKVVVTHKPAVKERKGVNPFTGEPAVFKAKPARKVIKIRPLKKLKDAANKK